MNKLKRLVTFQIKIRRAAIPLQHHLDDQIKLPIVVKILKHQREIKIEVFTIGFKTFKPMMD